MILSVLSSPALVSGLMVVRAKNPVHSVLFPILVFCDTSVYLFFHIGAIAVSFLFVVMMFNIQIAEIHEEVLRYLPVSGIIGLIFWWEIYTVYAERYSWTNLETLGNLLYTYYSVWFLVSSLILLVAMIGAIVLTMHKTTEVKRQDVFRRNALDSRRNIMRSMTIPNGSRRCFSSGAGGPPENYKETFKRWILCSEYRDFPGLKSNIDKLIAFLSPSEILFMVHTFPRDFPLLEILEPRDIREIIAHFASSGSHPKGG
ncbi:hypothetical protein ZWY2020_060057 [Hordeum vulgare]|nr:hypothetical protein ZWY2020_060057 [Hordeum vulgare]